MRKLIIGFNPEIHETIRSILKSLAGMDIVLPGITDPNKCQYTANEWVNAAILIKNDATIWKLLKNERIKVYDLDLKTKEVTVSQAHQILNSALQLAPQSFPIPA